MKQAAPILSSAWPTRPSGWSMRSVSIAPKARA
jgi:hypothetical protein